MPRTIVDIFMRNIFPVTTSCLR